VISKHSLVTQCLFLTLLILYSFVISGCVYPFSKLNAQTKKNITSSSSADSFTCVDNKSQLEASYSAVNPDNLVQIKSCAEQGHVQSQYIYGNIFYNNLHLRNAIEHAIYWWTEAGQQDYGDAWYRLGLLYTDGYDYDVDTRADTAKSAAYHQLGAIAGSSHAQYYLGVALYRGWGIKKDIAAAYRWWKIAAKNGNQQAHDVHVGSLPIPWYPVEHSPIWQLFNRVNNKSSADVFAILTEMLPYQSDTEVDLALAEVNYPEPPYFNMYLDIYQVLKHLPDQLVDMPSCDEFEKILQDEFSNELNIFFDPYVDAYIDEAQINSALWYALQRVCVVDSGEVDKNK